jgi:prevent-host-death family protein
MIMINISKDILSLSEFKPNTTPLLRRMKETEKPLVLTVNGKAEIVVQDAAAYQKMLELIDHLETVTGIRKGLVAVERDDVVSPNDRSQ